MSINLFGDATAKLQKGTWMQKPGSKGGGFRLVGGTKWNRRHVWIEHNAVHYGATERKSERSVPLRELVSARACGEKEILDEKGPAQLARNGWKLTAQGGKYIMFVTETATDRDDWVQGLTLFIHKRQNPELDEDDEATYRHLQQSSARFSEIGIEDSFVRESVSRSMSMISTHHFNSEEVDELIEEEEQERAAFEKYAKDKLSKARDMFFDDMEHVIEAESRAASEVRARASSVMTSGSPSPRRADDDAEADRALQIELQRRREAELQELRQIQLGELTGLCEDESLARALVSDTNDSIREGFASQHDAELRETRAELDRRLDEARLKYAAQQAQERSATLAEEKDTRFQVVREYEAVMSEMMTLEADRRRYVLELVRVRHEEARLAAVAALEGKKTDVVHAETNLRIAMSRSEGEDFTALRQQMECNLEAIRLSEMQRLQDEVARALAAHAIARDKLVSSEAGDRDALVTLEEDAMATVVAECQEDFRVAQSEMQARLHREAEQLRQELITQQSVVLRNERQARLILEKDESDQADEVVKLLEAERTAALQRTADRFERERLQLETKHRNEINALHTQEASDRNDSAKVQSSEWRHIMSLAQDSRREATSRAQARLKAESQLREQQWRALFSEENQKRTDISSLNERERDNTQQLYRNNREQVEKRISHRKALDLAAQTHEMRLESDARDALATDEVAARSAAEHVVTMLFDAFYMCEKIIEKESMEFAKLRITQDCDHQEAHEAYHRRVAAIVQLTDSEASARAQVHSDFDDERDEITRTEAQEKNAAHCKASERVRLIEHFVNSAYNQLQDFASEEQMQWIGLEDMYVEGKAQVEFAAAKRANDHVLMAQRELELHCSQLSSSETKARGAIFEEEGEEWEPLPDAFERKRANIERTSLERADLSRQQAHNALEEEREARHAIVSEQAAAAESAAAEMRTAAPAAAPAQSQTQKSSLDTAPPQDASPANEGSSVSSSASKRNSEERRQRRNTIREQKAVEVAEAQWQAEQTALANMASKGTWMFKPGSQSTKGSSVFRLGGTKWNRRYVWIRNNMFCYGEKPEKAEKPIPLKNLRKATLVSSMDAEREGCPKELQRYVWRLASTEKSIVFACQNETDRNNWLKYLEILTGQIDLASTINSVRSFAISAAYEMSVDGSGDDDDEFDDPFAETSPLRDDYDKDVEDKPLATRESQHQQASNPPPRLDEDGNLAMPQTFEEWCALLAHEEGEDRTAIQSVEAKHRQRVHDNWLEDAPIQRDHNPTPTSHTNHERTVSSGTLSAQGVNSQANATPAATERSGGTSTARIRSGTVRSNRDDATQRRADTAAAQAAQEAEERWQIVTKGAWMFKPRSKSNTSSTLMRSISSIGGTSWNKRYVWVEGTRLVYGEKPGKPEKSVQLGDVQSIYALPPETMKQEGAPRNLWTLGFKLTADDRSIMWAASDAKTRRAFIDFLTPMAKRQPSGLTARAPVAYRGSINNDSMDGDPDEDDGFEDPFADDYENDEASSQALQSNDAGREHATSETQQQEVATGGPVTRCRKKKALTRFASPDVAIPLTGLSMFLSQIEPITVLRRDEGLVGMCIANGDGLCLRSSGEVEQLLAGKMVRLMCVGRSMHHANRVTRRSSSVMRDDTAPKSSPRMGVKFTNNSTTSNSSFASLMAAPLPRSIEIEIEGPHHQHRTFSVGSVTNSLELLFVALHQHAGK